MRQGSNPKGGAHTASAGRQILLFESAVASVWSQSHLAKARSREGVACQRAVLASSPKCGAYYCCDLAGWTFIKQGVASKGLFARPTYAVSYGATTRPN